MATTTRLRPLLRPPRHPLSLTTTPQTLRTFHALLRPPTGTTPTPHRPHIARLPPPSPLSHVPHRPFSDLPTALSTAISLTQSLFTTIHTTTLTPWYLTIPLLALTMNLVARLPLALHSRRALVRRATLVPLLQAWRARHTMDVPPSPEREKEVTRLMADTTKRIYRIWGVQRWKDFLPLGALPVWLVAIEAIRRMCGGARGLIGTLVYGPGTGGPDGAAGETLAATGVEQGTGMEAAAAVEQGLAATTTGADMSLATGGCLWFPDLTVADPLHVLPFALSAVMVLNVMPRTQAGVRRVFGLDESAVVGGQPRLRLTRALVVVALAIGPATMNLPAAVHLYWLSSSTLTLLQAELTAHFMPLPKSSDVRPCTENEFRFIRPKREKVGHATEKEETK